MGEHPPCKRKVVGSKPTGSTNYIEGDFCNFIYNFLACIEKK